ncbi:aldehyde dehydrogenase (NAD+) [Haloferula luteola]|uniref:Aldehyde dehydrogenase n=1 Tax=Haloferula luteola TaxID=595692 RepID=A0A840V4S3_9BACT|nr:aldehyde dehydrogenase family protein [Haloferula luteola]MBB5350634.1 aldehyde dehydrogenase (NAD+) [Haloferula luteola]
MLDDFNRRNFDDPAKRARTAFQAAQQAFLASQSRPLKTRHEALLKLLSSLENHEDDLLQALQDDLGKPTLEAWLAEFHFLRQDLRLAHRKLSRWARPRLAPSPIFVQPAISRIHREPHGTALILAPWNYPLQLSLSPLIAAIAAGNTVVLKPSELAPASARLIARLVTESFHPQHVQVLLGDAPLAAALLDQPFDFFFFTGGEAIGRKVAAAAARHLKPCVLELGGKCPVIIDRGMPRDLVVQRVVDFKGFNAGQTCLAPDFVVVPEPERDQWVAAFTAEFRRRYTDPSDLARIVNSQHFDRLLRLTQGHPGIGPDHRDSLRFSPRVLAADSSHPAMQEEIFGPILPILGYSGTFPESLRPLPSPLASSIFSRNPAFIDRALRDLPSGGVTLNDVAKHAMNHHLPFGGKGPSGYGRYRGKFGFDTFSYARPITRRWLLPDLFTLSPPYRDRLKLLRRILR